MAPQGTAKNEKLTRKLTVHMSIQAANATVLKSSGGANSAYIEIQVGAIEISISECRRPKRLRKLSENAPAIGSEMASMTKETANTAAATLADRPNTCD